MTATNDDKPDDEAMMNLQQSYDAMMAITRNMATYTKILKEKSSATLKDMLVKQVAELELEEKEMVSRLNAKREQLNDERRQLEKLNTRISDLQEQVSVSVLPASCSVFLRLRGRPSCALGNV